MQPRLITRTPSTAPGTPLPARQALMVVGAGALMFALAIFAQTKADLLQPDSGRGDLLYLPNEKLLLHLTGGMSTIIADALWLDCIQYTAEEAKGPRNFLWLEQMVNTVVRLDPHFVDAYRFGAMFLSGLKADSDAGLNLLKRGMIANPRAWELPYEASMVYLLNRKDDPNARRQAAFFLAMSAATGNAPGLVTDVAAKLGAEEDLGEIERDMWISLLESGDDLLRDMAKRKLEEFKLREALKIINERIGIFRQQAGRPPHSVEELVEVGLLSGLPPDPLGGQFFVDVNGTAQNTSLLDELKTQHRNLIRDALERYKKAANTWPKSLQTLVDARYMTKIPPNPYPNAQWIYDPATGTLE